MLQATPLQGVVLQDALLLGFVLQDAPLQGISRGVLQETPLQGRGGGHHGAPRKLLHFQGNENGNELPNMSW